MIGRPRPEAAGFTLVELVVAVAIGGILIVLAFNGSSMLANRRLVGAARTLVSDLRMLEQRARAERTCYRIVFDLAGDTYNMDRYDPAQVAVAPAAGSSHCPAAAAWTPRVFRQEAADTVSRRMPRGVDLIATTFGADTLTYGPLGNPNGGTVTLRTQAGMERRVVVEVTGRVSIQP
ncbi:MAG: GspH/FimT family pseudopilin [Armatimonadota bacterium]|nr:GspH/FimT family pseudopilin [Armatimonadota bacterium]